MDLLITNARYAVTSNSANEILENVSIGITDGKISYIGTDKPASKKVYNAAGKLIAPGLINSHTHLGMSLSSCGIPFSLTGNTLSNTSWLLFSKGLELPMFS